MSQPRAQGVLDGKIALITGGTRGIGRGIAESMAEAGAHVLICGRAPAAAAEVAEAINAAGGTASPLAADLDDDAAVDELIGRAVRDHGGLDVLVNNAGIDDERPAIDYPLDLWRKVVRVNLEVPFRLSQAAAVHFIEKGGGAIVNVASIYGVVGGATECAYVPAKHGLVGLTKVLAIEWASQGVRVNAIAPGLIQTDMTKYLWEGGGGDAYVKARIPRGRIGQPRDIGAAAVFLASDGADFIHGETLVVDGGFIAS